MLIKGESRNEAEIPQVARDECQVMGQSGGRDQEIKVTDLLAMVARQRSAHDAEALDDLGRERQ